MKKPEFRISNRLIGEKYEPLIIAELGINHNGSLDLAINMADEAIKAGAEVIKHQTHIADEEMSDEAKYIIPKNAKVSIYEIIENCQLTEKEEYTLMEYIRSKGRIFISTPFSKAAVDRLVKFDVPAFKIGSGECNNYPLIKYISSFNKPIILSTGMNYLSTIEPAIKIISEANIPYAILHCTNIYPTPPHLVRLDCINLLRDNYPEAIIGLSDHTTSNYTSYGAIALGASIIERHFTDSMEREGPDIECSMDPQSLKKLIQVSKVIFSARGSYKGPIEDEFSTLKFSDSSVVAIKDINVGDTLNYDNIWLKRPGNGDFSAKDFEKILGKKVKSKIFNREQIKKESLAD